MADIRNEARLREVCLAIFNDPGLVDSILANHYEPAATYPLYHISKRLHGIGPGVNHLLFDVIDSLTGATIRSVGPMRQIGRGTFGEIFQDTTNNHVYKIIRTKIAKEDTLFRETMRETVTQIILQNITYPTAGGPVPCAPEIYGFYKFRATTPGHTGFVIEMEAMAQSADSPWAIQRFPTTFHSFVSMIHAIHEKGILYNHCDVKLNNMMYDAMGNLRLIDFGFSSIRFTFQDTGELFQLLSEDCGWHHLDIVASPLHPAPSPPGYYIQKDILQFLLTTWAHYGEHIKNTRLESYNFLIRLLRYYGVSDGTKTLLNVERPANKNTFTWSYNFNTKTRKYLHNSRPNLLRKMRPNTILAEYAANPLRYPIYEDDIVLLSLIQRVIETNNLIDFLPLFNHLRDVNVSFPGHPSVLQMVLANRKLGLLNKILQTGVDPNRPLFANITPLLYTVLNLREEPNVNEYIDRLLRAGADINGRAGPQNLPLLYSILRLPDPDIRNKTLQILLPYHPDMTFKTPGGQDAHDLADDTGDAETLRLIEEAMGQTTATTSVVPSAPPMPGGKRKIRKFRKVRSTRKKNAYRKKTRKQRK